VVDQDSALRPSEVEELLELRADSGKIQRNLVGREHLAFRGLPARIADEPGSTADDGNRSVTGSLKSHEVEHLQKTADVQAGRGGIETDVTSDWAGEESIGERCPRCLRGRRNILDESPKSKIFKKVTHVRHSPCVRRTRPARGVWPVRVCSAVDSDQGAPE